MLISFCWLLLMVAVGEAQDRVSYLPEGASKPLTVIGEIFDFTSRELVLRSGGATQRIPAERIQQIETQYQPEHLQGEERLARGETAEALVLFRRAMDKEPRPWVDREITALIVQAELRQQNLAGAVHHFRSILTTDPQTRHWGIAPLIWSPQLIPDALRVEMKTWLDDLNPPEWLLAGSLLLFDPVHGEAAERRLRTLARDTRFVFAVYAQAQLWRLQLASRQVTKETLEQWRELVERLPKELRPGPQYLYSRGFEVLGEPRIAAAEALWIPYVFAGNEILSARALFEAAENLGRTGLNTESRNLYRELIVRYPWSRDAALARSLEPVSR